ncbi:hypothetical protein B0T17DRAFT_545080 [Bombardia bombarda]|uniref:Uncharacterized protein n=1 Tax=Bombardia bombarda TaxID=252184 RepID=A0AA39TMK2_9PEZI|nr:hypothetical protein B0T17DRAFT_545080 [Bombardia bombarda]
MPYMLPQAKHLSPLFTFSHSPPAPAPKLRRTCANTILQFASEINQKGQFPPLVCFLP